METNSQPSSKLEKILNASEFNRFGLICVILTIVGCLGGIAVGLGAINSTISLSMIVVPTMLTLSLLLAVSPMKWILTSASTCVVIDSLMIVYLIAA